jgi:hypothetical protein
MNEQGVECIDIPRCIIHTLLELQKKRKQKTYAFAVVWSFVFTQRYLYLFDAQCQEGIGFQKLLMGRPQVDFPPEIEP